MVVDGRMDGGDLARRLGCPGRDCHDEWGTVSTPSAAPVHTQPQIGCSTPSGTPRPVPPPPAPADPLPVAQPVQPHKNLCIIRVHSARPNLEKTPIDTARIMHDPDREVVVGYDLKWSL